MSSDNDEDVIVVPESQNPEKLVWDTDVFVLLDRKNKPGFKSHVWNYFGLLKNRKTNSIYDSTHAYCKICVEEDHSLKTKYENILFSFLFHNLFWIFSVAGTKPDTHWEHLH